MYPVVRIGDPAICTCYPPTPPVIVFGIPLPPIPCPSGSVTQGSTDTFIEDRSVSRVGDSASNCCGGACICPNYILTGSNRTFVNNRPVARTIDTVSCGNFVSGSVRTFIQ